MSTSKATPGRESSSGGYRPDAEGEPEIMAGKKWKANSLGKSCTDPGTYRRGIDMLQLMSQNSKSFSSELFVCSSHDYNLFLLHRRRGLSVHRRRPQHAERM